MLGLVVGVAAGYLLSVPGQRFVPMVVGGALGEVAAVGLALKRGVTNYKALADTVSPAVDDAMLLLGDAGVSAGRDGLHVWLVVAQGQRRTVDRIVEDLREVHPTLTVSLTPDARYTPGVGMYSLRFTPRAPATTALVTR